MASDEMGQEEGAHGVKGHRHPDFSQWLELQKSKQLLRFLTCGSVDDGKSTLIGRLLFDTQSVAVDHLVELELDSKRIGTQNGQLDFALLVDGLSTEREQGITIDVAYRYFATAKRKFIVADTPGHLQYTRNMATGASNSDLAVLLVDASLGVTEQTRRHAFITSLLGIKAHVVAINKMDRVGYQKAVFDQVASDFASLAKEIGLEQLVVIPICALTGENLVLPSGNMPWYLGPTLLSHLETVSIGPLNEAESAKKDSFLLSVQRAVRPNDQFRGVAGTVLSGCVEVGDAVKILPPGTEAKVQRIWGTKGVQTRASQHQAVTLVFEDAVDCGRGAVVSSPLNPPDIADQFEATLFWMSEQALLPGRALNMKLGTQHVKASVSIPHWAYNMTTFDHSAAKTLRMNEVGVVTISASEAIALLPYSTCRSLGSFILVDQETNATLAAGMVRFSLRRSQNLHWQTNEVDAKARANLMGQTPMVIWFTGLSGSGKTTIANALEKRLHSSGLHTIYLDGDNLRHGLNKDLGFTATDRIENLRRVGEVAKLMTDAGLIVLAAFISPFQAERDAIRALLRDVVFAEVYVDASIETVEARDVKGLYKKARAGLLPNFTGIDSPYESPKNPEIHLRTDENSALEAVETVYSWIKARAHPNT